MKNENGITLVALVVTIIVIIILASVTTYSGIESYKYMKQENFVAKMKVIQEKVDLIKSEYTNWSGYVYYDTATEDGANAYKTNLSQYLKEIYGIETKVSSSDTTWIELDSTENIDDYFYISTDDIKDLLGLDGFEDSKFELAINFKTRKVFEKKGITIDGTTYHSQYNLSGGQKLVEEEEASTISYTTRNVTVKNYGLTADLVLDFKYTKDEQEVKVTNYEYQKSGESIWHSVTESNGTNYVVRISESGSYIIRVAGDSSSEVTKEITLVNPPVLANGMTAKYWDSNSWKNVTDMSAGTWYSYNNSETDESYWANAVDGSGNWWVWIPRFAYKIDNNKIYIEFLKDTSNTTTEGKIIASGYTVHPAFTNSTDGSYENGEWDSEITGFWVAKYQASSGGLFVPSKGILSVTASFTPTISNANAHLMKASERGAVIYLTYGTKKYSSNNNESGYAGGSNSTTVYTDQKKMSSTNNATGVYDLSTTNGEFVATQVVTSSTTSSKTKTYYLKTSTNVKGDGIGDATDTGDGPISNILGISLSQTSISNMADNSYLVLGMNHMFGCSASTSAGYRAVLITK
jgi:type II secretory pathway pseudopilin PulG